MPPCNLQYLHTHNTKNHFNGRYTTKKVNTTTVLLYISSPTGAIAVVAMAVTVTLNGAATLLKGHSIFNNHFSIITTIYLGRAMGSLVTGILQNDTSVIINHSGIVSCKLKS